MKNQVLPGIKSIAVFRALQVGDMLCAIPAIRAIRKAYPDASLTWIGLPWQQNLALRFANYIHDFIPFPGWPGLPEQAVDSHRVVEFLHQVQQRKFDLAIQLHGSGSFVNPMCALFGARFVAGLCTYKGYCPDKKLFVPITEDEHEVIRFLKVAKVLGGIIDDPHLEFPILPAEEEAYHRIRQQLNLSLAKYICIHPGARDPRRRWAPEYFSRVADALAKRGYTILLTGSVEEAALLEQVDDLMDQPALNLVDQCGHVGLGELAALIRDSLMLISNDTGVSHLAAAFQIPSVIIFSPFSDMRRWAPLDTQLHLSISPSQAQDPRYVTEVVIEYLEEFSLSVV